MEKKYNCIPCNYSTSDKCDYNRHIQTSKHKRGGKGKPPTLKSYNCSCGHSYKHRSGLSRHKRNCNQDNPTTNPIPITEVVEVNDMYNININELILNPNISSIFIKQNMDGSIETTIIKTTA